MIRLFEDCLVIAIIRGVTPAEAVTVGQALFGAGIRVIEAPMNSPQPLESIKALAAHFGDAAVIRAGTVLTEADVEAVHASGGRICVSPNVNERVIKAALRLGVVPVPGVYSPSEAFAAIDAGARILKLFPASAAGRDNYKAMRAVLPAEVRVIAVGGVSSRNAVEFMKEGFAGIGAGSELYSPGRAPDELRASA